MAEAPAAAPEDTLYQGIMALIQKTYNEEESPRGNNTASLAVHAAMAEAIVINMTRKGLKYKRRMVTRRS